MPTDNIAWQMNKLTNHFLRENRIFSLYAALQGTEIKAPLMNLLHLIHYFGIKIKLD